VGVDRGDLPLFSISVTSSMSVNFATVYRSDARLSPADDDQISVLGHAW